MIWQGKSSCLLWYSEFRILSRDNSYLGSMPALFNSLSIIILDILTQVMQSKFLEQSLIGHTYTCADVGQRLSRELRLSALPVPVGTLKILKKVPAGGQSKLLALSVLPCCVYDQNKSCQNSKSSFLQHTVTQLCCFLGSFSGRCTTLLLRRQEEEWTQWSVEICQSGMTSNVQGNPSFYTYKSFYCKNAKEVNKQMLQILYSWY